MCAIYFRSSPFTSKVPKNDVKLESFESEENCVCMRGKLFYLPYHPAPPLLLVTNLGNPNQLTPFGRFY